MSTGCQPSQQSVLSISFWPEIETHKFVMFYSLHINVMPINLDVSDKVQFYCNRHCTIFCRRSQDSGLILVEEFLSFGVTHRIYGTTLLESLLAF